ncbi:MAG: hypothetical protein OCD01_11315 [Fibrobacterales bacterium]
MDRTRFSLMFKSIATTVFVLSTLLSAHKTDNNLYGFDAISLGGGGRALDLETSTNSGNPAPLSTKHTDTFESGMSGFGVDPYYYLSWMRAVSENSAMNLAYTIDPLLDFEVQTVSFAISLAPLKKISVGFSGMGRRSEQEEYSMDFSAGIQYRHNNFLKIAFDTRSIFETLDSTASNPDISRSFGLGSAIHLGKTRTYALIDVETHSLTFKRPITTVGLGTIAGTNNNLKVQGGLALFNRNSHLNGSLAFGLKMQERFFNTLISAHYAIKDVAVQGHNFKSMSHTIGFGMVLDPFIDTDLPIISAQLDRSILLLSPTSPAARGIHFQLKASDITSNLKEWYLVICTVTENFSAKEAVKSFSGRGIPPKTIQWEGRGDDNERLQKGYYTYRFIVTDTAENVNSTKWQLLEIQ